MDSVTEASRFRIETDDLEQLVRSLMPSSPKADQGMKVIEQRLDLQEERHLEITRIFDNCFQMLERFQNECGTTSVNPSDSDPETMVIESSSDDEDAVQFVEATYEPATVKKRMSASGQLSDHLAAAPLRSPASQLPIVAPLPPPMPPAALHPVPAPVPPPAPAPPPATPPALAPPSATPPATPPAQLPARYVLKQIPPHLQAGQRGAMPLLSSALQVGVGGGGGGGVMSLPSLTSSGADIQIRPRMIELAVGLKLYGKKFNEIWYKGTLLDIQHRDKPRHERRYRLKFDGKGMKVLNGKHIAYQDRSNEILPVGSRVIAAYKEGETTSGYYAGIIAEPPNVRNTQRYLVFFDDGYAQYSSLTDIMRVVDQSRNVWDDIHEDSREFIRGYLQQYPERPMVRLQKGQMVKTEWNGKWWGGLVQEVDASLVKMYFEADDRVEWIYRGSTRLEPLYTELANAEASKVSGKGRRHHVQPKSRQKPFVEYTRGVEEAARRAAAANAAALTSRQLGPVTLAPVTLAPVTSAPVTSAPVTSALVTSAPVTSVPVTSAPVTSAPVTLAPVTSAPVTAAPVTAPVTTAVNAADGQKRRSVAKKTTSKPARVTLPQTVDLTTAVTTTVTVTHKKSGQTKEKTAVEKLSLEALSLEKDKASPEIITLDESCIGERVDVEGFRDTPPIHTYELHTCGSSCVAATADDPAKHLGSNPLLIPQMCGWERQISKSTQNGRRAVFYRAPCARRLRSLDEVARHLIVTASCLTIDFFCFDVQLHTASEFVPVKTFCNIKDISYGKEVVAISCVNGIDRQYPDYVEYSNIRNPAKGVKINVQPEFLLGCDCTDGCMDASKCRCIQLTVEAAKTLSQEVEEPPGYCHRRLTEPHLTGIYECNSTCKCSCRCANRVIQNGLQLRLQVFKTEKRGWGLRCLDDIPAGGFICIYVGQLLTEQGADDDGQQYGDEYLAELDYIEVVERMKQGYESGAEEGEGEGSEETDSASERDRHESDSSYSGGDEGKRKKKPVKLVLTREGADGRDSKGWSVKSVEEAMTAAAAAAAAAADQSVIIILSDDDDDGGAAASTISYAPICFDELPDLEETPPNKEGSNDDSGGVTIKITDATSLNMDGIKVDDSDEESNSKTSHVSKRTTRSQTHSRFSNLPNPKTKSSLEPHENDENERLPFLSTRTSFRDEFCYVMDAKSIGNLGRYLNHSCSPNVFVQNVFVDTHDLRFPWIAFFAQEYIRAGTELTWDYNYKVGSVPGKILYCYCGSAECRGRLL